MSKQHVSGWLIEAACTLSTIALSSTVASDAPTTTNPETPDDHEPPVTTRPNEDPAPPTAPTTTVPGPIKPPIGATRIETVPGTSLVVEAGAYLVLGRNTDALNGGVPMDVQYGVEFIHFNTADEIVLLDQDLAPGRPGCLDRDQRIPEGAGGSDGAARPDDRQRGRRQLVRSGHRPGQRRLRHTRCKEHL